MTQIQTHKRVWLSFCASGCICPSQNFDIDVIGNPITAGFQDRTCQDNPHRATQYVDSVWIKEERTEQEVERWEQYLETQDEKYLDDDRVLKLGCLPVWCKKCGIRAVRHLIPVDSTQQEARERIADSICGRCRGINYTPEELKAQDEYERTEEAQSRLPQGRWEGDEWQPTKAS
jgi:hypothetical protein